MRDFDVDRASRLQGELEFKIGGETFRRRPGVRPEVLARYFTIAGLDDEEAVKRMDETLLAFIHPDDHERYIARRQDEVDPLTLIDLSTVAEWMVVEETRRPTEASSGSSAGRSETDGTSSTDGSPSPEQTPTPSQPAAS